MRDSQLSKRLSNIYLDEIVAAQKNRLPNRRVAQKHGERPFCILKVGPAHWSAYYDGTEQERAFKRKFSLSDRARYYWNQPEVQSAVDVLLRNLAGRTLPYSLASQFLGDANLTAEQFIRGKIQKALDGYILACQG